MITGEDYNLAPLTSSQNILKVKSVNRTSSGISRNFDLIDASGKYSSVNVFADDGYIYKQDSERQLAFNFISRSEVFNFIKSSLVFVSLNVISPVSFTINTWPNNAEVISVSTGFESDSIRRNLRGESILTYGYMWKRFKKGNVLQRIPSIPEAASGFSLKENLFYNEPILKIDVLENDIQNKFESINEIPVPFMEQLLIYEEAITTKNINNDDYHWIFEKDFNNIQT
jgi:hypothetical protein